MKSGEIVAHARALIGVRFRPQGRSAEQGLDCIGVAAMAMGVERVRRDYCLRSSDAEEANDEFDRMGFLRIAQNGAVAGDFLLVQPAAGHLHVVVLTPEGYVHAEMRLRRVVEVPGAVPWRVLSAWRHPEHEAAASFLSQCAGEA